MEVINVIVHDNDTGIISIDSFGVLDAESKDDTVTEAENLFKEKCVELKFDTNDSGTDRNDIRERNFYREELDDSLSDGYEDIGEHTVSIVWSYIENVQL